MSGCPVIRLSECSAVRLSACIKKLIEQVHKTHYMYYVPVKRNRIFYVPYLPIAAAVCRRNSLAGLVIYFQFENKLRLCNF